MFFRIININLCAAAVVYRTQRCKRARVVYYDICLIGISNAFRNTHHSAVDISASYACVLCV
jgi:hypothetical protein